MRIAPIILSSLVLAGAAYADPKPSDSHGSVDIVTSVGRGRLGITAISISPELRAYFRAPGDRGVLVDAVQPDSPAASAGLRAGDVVIAVEGAPIRSARDVIDALATHKKGDSVVLEVVRGGKQIGLKATLDRDPAPPAPELESLFKGFGSDDWQQEIDAMKKHMEQLEQRLHKLERT